MAIIKKRPTIRLRAPRSVRAGEILALDVVLDAKRPVPVDEIRVRFSGHDTLSVTLGQHQDRETLPLLSAEGIVAGRVRVAAGRSLYPFRVDLPPDMPPTRYGKFAWTRYLVDVRARIPWWPDARGLFEIHVRPARGRPPPPGRPIVHSTDPEGPRAREPHAEVSLATDVFAPAETLSGAVALRNCAFNRYGELRIALVGNETLRGAQAAASHEFARYEVRRILSDPAEGAPHAFAIRLPPALAPSGLARYWGVEWALEVSVSRGFGRAPLVVRCPVRVVAPSEARSPHSFVAPAVGSPRVREIWRAVGTRAGLTFGDSSERLVGRVDDIDVALWREHRGRRGIYLVGALDYPSLGLDLRVEPRRVRSLALRHRRRVDISGREAAQVRAFVAAASLDGLLHPLRLTTMDDERAEAEMRDAGQSASRLGGFTDWLMAFARDLVAARARIPPPAEFRAALPAWKQLASRLGGRLAPGPMSVAGRFAGMEVDVRTVWSESVPLHTLLTMRAPHPLRADPAAAAAGFGIADDMLSFELPAPLRDPAPAIERLGEMALLVDRLAPRGGAYR